MPFEPGDEEVGDGAGGLLGAEASCAAVMQAWEWSLSAALPSGGSDGFWGGGAALGPVGFDAGTSAAGE